MSNTPKKPPFSANDFMQRLSAYVKGAPMLAPRAYVSAALRLRAEARRPENLRSCLQLQELANRLDTLAAESVMPEADAESGEIITLYADNSREPTEYDGIVADLAASTVGADGEPNDELHAAMQFQDLQGARDADVAIPVQATPASARPGITIFGQEVLTQFGGSPTASAAGQFGGAISAVAEGPVVRWDGREQETMAVTCAIAVAQGGGGGTYPAAADAAANPFSYRPYARVLWGGSRGQPNEAIIDVGRGVQFSIACNYLYVNVGMDAPGAGDTAGSMVISGTFGFYTSDRSAPTYRTGYIDALAGSGSANIVRPLFATQLAGADRSDATVPITLNFLDVNGRTLYQRIILANTYLLDPVALSSDVFSIAVNNTSLSTAVNVRLVFALSL